MHNTSLITFTTQTTAFTIQLLIQHWFIVPVPNSDDAVENNRLLEAPQATDSTLLPVDTASDHLNRGDDGAVCDDTLVKVQSSTGKDKNEKKKSGGSDDDDDDSELTRSAVLVALDWDSISLASVMDNNIIIVIMCVTTIQFYLLKFNKILS